MTRLRTVASRVAWAAAGLYAVALHVFPPLRRYLEFEVQTFDFGILLQATGLWARGEPAFVTARGVHALADNQEYLQLLLAPLHYLPATPYLILLVHSIAIAAVGAAVGWWLRSLGAAAVATALAVLLSPYLLNMSYDVAHVEAFAAVFLVLLFRASVSGDTRSAFVWLLLALACKEDVAISAGTLMAVVLWRRGDFRLTARAAGAGLTICAAVLLVNILVVLPHFKAETCRIIGTPVPYSVVSSPEPVSPFFRGIAVRLLDPEMYPLMLGRVQVWLYLLGLTWPLLIFLRRDPWLLLLPLPAAAINIASGNPYALEGLWHYDHSTFGLDAAGLAYGVLRSSRPMRGAGFVLAVSIVTHLSLPGWYHAPLTKGLERSFWRIEKDPRVPIVERLDAALPRDVTLSADYTTLSYLAENRSRAHMFPNPLESEYFGIGGVCTELVAPPRADVVVLHDELVLSPEHAALVTSGFETWQVHVLDEVGVRVLLDTRGARYAELRRALHNFDPRLGVSSQSPQRH